MIRPLAIRGLINLGGEGGGEDAPVKSTRVLRAIEK